MRSTPIALVLLMTACAPSESSVATAIAATEATLLTPTIEPTPTRVPLSELNLEPILVQPGDLPAGLSAGQVRAQPPEMFDGIPSPVQSIFQQFADNDGPAGGVSVFLYESLDLVDSAYAFILSGLGEDADQGALVGDRSAYMTIDVEILGTSTLATDLLFSHCHSVIHIRMSNTRLDGTLAYAQRLDGRIQPLICSD